MHSPATKTIRIGRTSLTVEIADTPPLIERGLSGRAALEHGQGMLFVYNIESRWEIWMKDMRFSVDIMWADAQGTIVMIASNISPATFPYKFYPPRSAKYVLEVPAGFAVAHDIAEGMTVINA